jgi:hypothetical protein
LRDAGIGRAIKPCGIGRPVAGWAMLRAEPNSGRVGTTSVRHGESIRLPLRFAILILHIASFSIEIICFYGMINCI